MLQQDTLGTQTNGQSLTPNQTSTSHNVCGSSRCCSSCACKRSRQLVSNVQADSESRVAPSTEKAGRWRSSPPRHGAARVHPAPHIWSRYTRPGRHMPHTRHIQTHARQRSESGAVLAPCVCCKPGRRTLQSSQVSGLQPTRRIDQQRPLPIHHQPHEHQRSSSSSATWPLSIHWLPLLLAKDMPPREGRLIIKLAPGRAARRLVWHEPLPSPAALCQTAVPGRCAVSLRSAPEPTE